MCEICEQNQNILRAGHDPGAPPGGSTEAIPAIHTIRCRIWGLPHPRPSDCDCGDETDETDETKGAS